MIFILFILLWSYLVKQRKSKKSTFFFVSFFAVLMSSVATLILWRSFGRRLLNIPALLIPFTNDNLSNTVLSLIAVGTTLLFIFSIDFLVSREYLLKKSKIKIYQWILFAISGLLIFLAILLYMSSTWAMMTFNNVTFDQMMYLFSQPLTGTDPRQIIEYLVNPLLTTIFYTMLILTSCYVVLFYRISVKRRDSKKRLDPSFVILFFLSVISVGGSVVLSVNEIGYEDIKAYYFEDSKLYNQYYIKPEESTYVFPEKKRNLIYIFLESLESSYASKELGGVKDENLIPNLTNMALDKGVHFSNGEYLGGMLPIPGASHTASAMVAQTAGIPLKTASGVNLHVNNYGKDGEKFLPGAYSLGEILETEGYNQVLFFGSDAAFAGRDKYFQQHGNYEIRDYNWAKEKNLIPEDYKVWWGYEDAKMFEFAKETLRELGSQSEPFNFTLLTADTHFEDGYLDESTPNIFDDQYSNVIHNSDQQILSFIEWIETQSFYEDTTIVVVGDHLTMDKDFMRDTPESYQRTIYNLFLNTGYPTGIKTNRLFSAVDMLPTTLSAMGVELSNNRLGLGVDLFSEEDSMIESLGYDAFYTELMKRSTFYERNFMKGTDLKQILNNQAK